MAVASNLPKPVTVPADWLIPAAKVWGLLAPSLSCNRKAGPSPLSQTLASVKLACAGPGLGSALCDTAHPPQPRACLTR